MRHKHADLIHAWAEGACIQFQTHGGSWVDVVENQPAWEEITEYRIKPEKKPDVVRHCYADIKFTFDDYTKRKPNLRLTFDGETGKLKSAEIIK